MQPWEKEGISKATWYRRRKKGVPDTSPASMWKNKHDIVAAELEHAKAELAEARELIGRLERLSRPHVKPRSVDVSVKAVAWKAKP